MSFTFLINPRSSLKLVAWCLFLIVIMVAECPAATSYVNPGQSIQDAIDTAIDGEEIVVNPGTYMENISINGKNIVLRSSAPTSPTVVATTTSFIHCARCVRSTTHSSMGRSPMSSITLPGKREDDIRA